MNHRPPTVAVIGGGFSGTLTALHLVNGMPGLRVHLIERRTAFGRGLAYGTPHPSHCLNVPAGRMSAFPDRPHDFLEWLRGLAPGSCPSLADGVSENSFASRRLYGSYLQHLLEGALARRDHRSGLRLAIDEAVDIEHKKDGLAVRLATGRTLEADIVVLALGNGEPAPPFDPAPLAGLDVYRNDPWAPDSLSDLDPEAPVMLVGTGLTMVDQVLLLLDRGHTGAIHAVSRRGRVPLHHAVPPVAPVLIDPGDLPAGPAALLRYMRERAAAEPGRPWQALVDGLRPHLPAIWQSFSEEERRRFLRHLRPFWEVHRHRLAPTAARRLGWAMSTGQLRVLAGRIGPIRAGNPGAVVEVTLRGGGTVSLPAARILNCTSPGEGAAAGGSTLMRNLMGAGSLSADPLGLGIRVAADGTVLDASGTPSLRLLAIGPLTKGRFWEVTAVPEIRQRAKDLADTVAGRLVDRIEVPPAPETRPLLGSLFGQVLLDRFRGPAAWRGASGP